MRSTRQRWAFSLVVATLAVPLAVVSVAFACGRLATLQLGPERVGSGGQMSGFGRNYTTAPTASPVEIHFNRRNGPVLWSGRPDPSGTIRPRVTLPKARPGYYVLLATQTTGTGAASPGTPGRTQVFVGTRRQQKKAERSGVGAWPVTPAGGGSGGGPGGGLPGDAGLLAALISGGLLAAAAGLLHADRRGGRPAAA